MHVRSAQHNIDTATQVINHAVPPRALISPHNPQEDMDGIEMLVACSIADSYSQYVCCYKGEES